MQPTSSQQPVPSGEQRQLSPCSSGSSCAQRPPHQHHPLWAGSPSQSSPSPCQTGLQTTASFPAPAPSAAAPPAVLAPAASAGLSVPASSPASWPPSPVSGALAPEGRQHLPLSQGNAQGKGELCSGAPLWVRAAGRPHLCTAVVVLVWMGHHELAEGIAGPSVSRGAVWGPLLPVPVRQGRPARSHCHPTVCIPLGCEPRDPPEMSSVYCRPQYHSQGGERSLFLYQNPPSPSCLSKSLYRAFVSSWPLEQPTNKPGCTLRQCLLLPCQVVQLLALP